MPGTWVGRSPKLTEAQLAELREVARLRKALPSNRELAAKYGVSTGTIVAATNGKRPKRYGA